jgi:hypothetical protein
MYNLGDFITNSSGHLNTYPQSRPLIERIGTKITNIKRTATIGM